MHPEHCLPEPLANLWCNTIMFSRHPYKTRAQTIVISLYILFNRLGLILPTILSWADHSVYRSCSVDYRGTHHVYDIHTDVMMMCMIKVVIELVKIFVELTTVSTYRAISFIHRVICGISSPILKVTAVWMKNELTDVINKTNTNRLLGKSIF